MLDNKWTFKNSLGESITFGENGLYFSENALRNYSYETVTTNGKITNLKKGVQEFTIGIIIANVDETEAIAKKNQISSIFEKDIIRKNQGYFELNDFRIYGYVVKSVKGNYVADKRYLPITITFASDNPVWVKSHTYDISSGSSTNTIDLSGFSKEYEKLDFSVRFTGITSEPSLNLLYTATPIVYGVTSYDVSDDLQYILINTREKIVTETFRELDDFGVLTNVSYSLFKFRTHNNYIFQKLVGGRSYPVGLTGASAATITVYEERSEPTWI